MCVCVRDKRMLEFRKKLIWLLFSKAGGALVNQGT